MQPWIIGRRKCLLSDASQGIAVNGYASRIWKEDVLCSLRAVNLTRGLKELLYSQDIIAPYYTKTGIYLSMPVFLFPLAKGWGYGA